jgi:DNA-3-methyladenine glycosylase I
MPEMIIRRCPWAETDPLMRKYHDQLWGKPCHDQRELFQMLVLEGFQAGLSWLTVLKKWDEFCRVFDDFDMTKIAAYDAVKFAELMDNPGIIRNRLKIQAAITNAQLCLRLGSLDDFIWNYVDGVPVVNTWQRQEEIPATSPLSDLISRDMKRLGFKFVGSTIIYSYLEAIGVINDHLDWCSFR